MAGMVTISVNGPPTIKRINIKTIPMIIKRQAFELQTPDSGFS